MADDHPHPDRQLSDRLRELEKLLESHSENPAGGGAPAHPDNVPILDEVVEPEDAEQDPAVSLPPDIAALARRLEEKFSLELDEIIHILKGNLKSNITEELLAQLKLSEDNHSNTDADTGEE